MARRYAPEMLAGFDPVAAAEAIVRALEADATAAQRRSAAADAQPCTGPSFIRLDARRGRRHVHAWVTGVTFSGGDGDYRISKFAYSDNALKAKRFGPEAARAIARQMAGSFNVRGVTLEAK